MDSTAPTGALVDISANRYFVLGAYFLAFFPWAVMNNIDFISEKWRTIRRTRRLAYAHMFSSIVPLIYVAVYAEAQRQAKDEKELGAALAALMLNVFQLLRTVMGKVQVDVFSEWCKHAVECIRALQGADEENNVRRSDGGYQNVLITRDNVQDVEERVRVNNTVVDNELGGRDVRVLPSWERVWNGLQKGEFAPHKWLVTDQAKLSTIRWSSAYLCGMGDNWGIPDAFPSDATKKLATFFSNEMSVARQYLQKVTWNIAVDDAIEMISVSRLGDAVCRADLSGETETAYGTEVRGFCLTNPVTVDSYSFEIDSLASSYPADDNSLLAQNRECVSVGLVHSLLLAKHLGVEKLKSIRRYYVRYCIPTLTIPRESFEVFLNQTTDVPLNESEIFRMCFDDNNVPMFPYRMQMIALWEQDTNWRVLQASAHCDIEVSLYSQFDVPLEAEPDGERLFDYWSNITRLERKDLPPVRFLGAVIETVRTFLAEWLTAAAQEPNWEPAIPDNFFQFDLSENVCYVERCSIHSRTLIWVCQQALQKEVSRTWSEHPNLPSSHVLIMLFLLGFPNLKFEYDCDDQVVPSENNESLKRYIVRGNNAMSSSTERTMNVSIRAYRAFSRTKPKDISVLIWVDFENGRVTLQLKTDCENSQFIWQDWVDTAMGIMKGLGEGTSDHDRWIMQGDLREPMVKMSPLLDKDSSELCKKAGIAQVWMGWPPFDMRICKFEIDQWFKAKCITFRDPMNWEISYDELKQAKRVLETIFKANVDERMIQMLTNL